MCRFFIFLYIYIFFTTVYIFSPQKSELIFDIFDTSSDYQ